LREYNQIDHLTVAVEFKTDENDSSHHHAGREIQLLEAKNKGIPEAWQLIIEQEDELDEGTYRIAVRDPR
jgi:hypothetical protein